MNVDNLVEEEISYLSARITTADSVISEFAILMNSVNSVRANVQLSKAIMQQGDPASAYIMLLDSLSAFVDINKNLVESILKLRSILDQSNESQS